MMAEEKQLHRIVKLPSSIETVFVQATLIGIAKKTNVVAYSSIVNIGVFFRTEHATFAYLVEHVSTCSHAITSKSQVTC